MTFDGSPCVLLWNYSSAEKAEMDRFLAEVKAPPAVLIAKDQGYLPLKEIILAQAHGAQEFECAEKVVLFYKIPSKGIAFLIEQAKSRPLPRPIYAAVTEFSINWPLHELLADLIRERAAFAAAARQGQP